MKCLGRNSEGWFLITQPDEAPLQQGRGSLGKQWLRGPWTQGGAQRTRAWGSGDPGSRECGTEGGIGQAVCVPDLEGGQDAAGPPETRASRADRASHCRGKVSGDRQGVFPPTLSVTLPSSASPGSPSHRPWTGPAQQACGGWDSAPAIQHLVLTGDRHLRS